MEPKEKALPRGSANCRETPSTTTPAISTDRPGGQPDQWSSEEYVQLTNQLLMSALTPLPFALGESGLKTSPFPTLYLACKQLHGRAKIAGGAALVQFKIWPIIPR